MMNIKRAKEEISSSIEAYLTKDEYGEYAIPSMRQRPILLMGPPGIGKTQIMEQVARECGVGLVAYTITHHTRQSAIGLPFIEKRTYDGREYAVTEYTMSEIVASVYDYMEKTGLREGILFIDEINCVSETLAPTMLQFLQYKTFGNHKIPDGWIIVTAGNPPEFNKSVREFDIATLDRLKKIDVEADFDVWKEYAVKNAVHPAVISYLEARREHFYKVETTVDGRAFATPRGWEDLARFLEIYEMLGKKVDREVIYQYIEHSGIAKDFASYLELYHKYRADYQIEKILSGTSGAELVRRVSEAAFDEKLSVVSLLLAGLNEQFIRHYEKERFLELLHGELKKLKEENGPLPEQLELLASLSLAELENRRKAGVSDRKENRVLRDAADRLSDYSGYLRKEHLSGWSSGFERIRELFGEENKASDQSSEQTLQMLEHAFDFMEVSFGDSQETVIFVTELNTSYYSISFLRDNKCERYYEYNKRLLFENREDEIRRRLEEL